MYLRNRLCTYATRTTPSGHAPPNAVFRLPLIDPWHDWPGVYSEETLEWVHILGATATTARDNRPLRSAPLPI